MKNYHLVDENNNTIIFDLILSFEHFEHITPQTFNIFLDNIKKHSSKKTMILATASTWKYPKSNVHCNVKTHNEWKIYLNEMGFEVQPSSFIREDTKPFNFGVDKTSELYFNLKYK